jgi:hypothetical protein
LSVTPTAWVAGLAAVAGIAGVAASIRYLSGRWQLAGLMGTLALVTVIGWIAWYIGIQV